MGAIQRALIIQKDGMNPFGKTSIKRRKLVSFLVKMIGLFYKLYFLPIFCAVWVYQSENFEQFKDDLQKIRPMLDELFDFERNLIEQTGDDTKTFTKSVSYLYLRSGLIERWNTLRRVFILIQI